MIYICYNLFSKKWRLTDKRLKPNDYAIKLTDFFERPEFWYRQLRAKRWFWYSDLEKLFSKSKYKSQFKKLHDVFAQAETTFKEKGY